MKKLVVTMMVLFAMAATATYVACHKTWPKGTSPYYFAGKEYSIEVISKGETFGGACIYLDGLITLGEEQLRSTNMDEGWTVFYDYAMEKGWTGIEAGDFIVCTTKMSKEEVYKTYVLFLGLKNPEDARTWYYACWNTSKKVE